MYTFTIYMTTGCNFKCKYCYENYKKCNQLDGTKLIDTIEFIMNYSKRDKILLDFLGGEPLLKKDLIYNAVEYIKRNYSDRIVKYYITTNGSLLDDKFIEFMQENSFTIRLSFDGNKKTHDLNRVAKDGNSCYENILKNIEKVKNSGIAYAVRMTVAENTVPYMYENICFLHERGLNNICMIMDVNLKLTEQRMKILEQQVKKITKYYINEYIKGNKFSLDQFDGKLLNVLCDFGGKFCMCNAGITNFKIMPNGDIYPCGFLTNDKKFAIGNISTSINIEKAHNIAISNYDKENRACLDCKIRDFCHGMKCGYMNFINTGKINVPSDAECKCEKIFFNGIKEIMSFYSELSTQEIKKNLGSYIELIKRNGYKFSQYGEAINDRIVWAEKSKK